MSRCPRRISGSRSGPSRSQTRTDCSRPPAARRRPPASKARPERKCWAARVRRSRPFRASWSRTRAVVGGRGDGPAVGVEGDGADRLAGDLDRPQEPARLGVPEPDRAVERARGEPAIGGEGDLLDRRCVAPQDVPLGERPGLPDPDRRALGGRDQPAAGPDGDGGDPPIPGVDRRPGLAGPGVPEPQQAAAGGGQEAAVGRVGQAGQLAVVAESAEDAAGAGLADQDEPIDAAAGEPAAVGGISDRCNRAVVVVEGRQVEVEEPAEVGPLEAPEVLAGPPRVGPRRVEQPGGDRVVGVGDGVLGVQDPGGIGPVPGLGRVADRDPPGRGDPRDPEQQGEHRHQDRPGQRRPPTDPLPRHHPDRRRPGADRPAVEVAVEVVRQLARRGVAAQRLLLQALQADRLQVAVDRRRDLPGRADRLLEDQPERLGRRAAEERRPTRDQGVEQRAEAVDVDRGRQPTAVRVGLLGRHVHGRAGDADELGVVLLAVPARLEALGEAEVGDHRPALAVEQHVRGLQVAVEDADHVRVVDGAGDLGDQPGGGPVIAAERLAAVDEAAALDQPHRVVVLAVALAVLEDRHDPRVLQGRQGRRLVMEAADLVLGEPGGPDHLQGHVAAEPVLAGPVDDPHPALAELLDDLVVAVAIAGRDRPDRAVVVVVADRRPQGRDRPGSVGGRRLRGGLLRGDRPDRLRPGPLGAGLPGDRRPGVGVRCRRLGRIRNLRVPARSFGHGQALRQVLAKGSSRNDFQVCGTAAPGCPDPRTAGGGCPAPDLFLDGPQV